MIDWHPVQRSRIRGKIFRMFKFLCSIGWHSWILKRGVFVCKRCGKLRADFGVIGDPNYYDQMDD